MPASNAAKKDDDSIESLLAIEGEIVEDDQLEHDQAVDSLLTELVGEDDVTVKVFRQPLKGRKLTYLFSCQPEDLSMDQIQDKLRDDYNGGEFRVQIRRSGSLVANKPLSIERPSTIPGSPEPAKIPEGNNMNETMQLFMMQMQESNKQQASEMQKMMMMQAQENNKMMMGVLTALASKPEKELPPPQDPMQMITAFAALKDAFTPPPDKTDKVDVLMKGIELAQGLSAGEANSSSVLQTAIKEVGGPLIEAAKLATAAQAAKQTSTQHAQQPAQTQQQEIQHNLTMVTETSEDAENESGDTNVQTDTQNAQSEQAQFIQQFKPQITQLNMLASANANPETYANMIIDMAGDEKAAQLFNQDQAYELLVHYFPEIEANKEWWLELIEIGQELTVPEEPVPGEVTPIDDAEGPHSLINVSDNDTVAGNTASDGDHVSEQAPTADDQSTESVQAESIQTES